MKTKTESSYEYASDNANILNTEDDIRKAYEAGWDAAVKNSRMQ